MPTRVVYRIVFLLIVFSMLGSTPVVAAPSCFTDMARCFESTASIDSFWYRIWEAFDCELGFITCVRIAVLGR